MDTELEELDSLISRKVEEGTFASRQAAIKSIMEWLDKLDEHFIQAEMRNEDA